MRARHACVRHESQNPNAEFVSRPPLKLILSEEVHRQGFKVALTGESPLARLHALWGLGQLGGENNLAVLDQVRRSDREPYVREAASKALEGIGDDAWGALRKAMPITYACVQSEKSVAQTTKPIASGPALSWIQRQVPE